ncbi:MAG: suppressor of fused domain protein [Jatrophihabitantaceae bacterium]
MNGPEPLRTVERVLSARYGQIPSRASVSFLGVEALEVLRFEPAPGERAYFSLGMSRRPMTAATETAVSTRGQRAELLLHIRDQTDACAEVWRALAILAAAPAVEAIVHTPGMTVDTGRPLVARSACTGGVIAESALAPIETSAGQVAVLQVLPATSPELAWARVHGSAALQVRWVEHGTDLLDLGRKAVPLG